VGKKTFVSRPDSRAMATCQRRESSGRNVCHSTRSLEGMIANVIFQARGQTAENSRPISDSARSAERCGRQTFRSSAIRHLRFSLSDPSLVSVRVTMDTGTHSRPGRTITGLILACQARAVRAIEVTPGTCGGSGVGKDDRTRPKAREPRAVSGYVIADL